MDRVVLSGRDGADVAVIEDLHAGGGDGLVAAGGGFALREAREFPEGVIVSVDVDCVGLCTK